MTGCAVGDRLRTMPSVTGSDLLERAELQDAAARALRDARHGEGRLLVIEGPAGIGKSSLLADLRSAVEAGQHVLSARASELERGFAFGVVRQLLEGVARDPERAAVAFDGPAAAARECFSEVGSEQPEGFALLHGLYWMVLNLAEAAPLALVVDDLHWCDGSSSVFWRTSRTDWRARTCCSRSARGRRSGQPGGAAAGTLLDEPAALHLYPQPLSPAASGRLLAEQFGEAVHPAFAAACFEATDGNPLMLRQLARSLSADGTSPSAGNAAAIRRSAHRALGRTILARIGRCSPEAARLARVVAVLQPASVQEAMVALPDLSPDAFSAAWQELARADVLRPEVPQFVHALVRDAVYFDLSTPVRGDMHLAAAWALRRSGATPERIASQLGLAPCRGDAWVAATARAAGEDALRRGAPDAAAQHLRRALAEPIEDAQRTEVLTMLASALTDTDAVAAIDVFRELEARLANEPEALVSAKLGLGRCWRSPTVGRRPPASSGSVQAGVPPQATDLVARLEASRAMMAVFGADDPEILRTLAAHRQLPADASGASSCEAGWLRCCGRTRAARRMPARHWRSGPW